MCLESITTDYKLSRNIALNRDNRFKGSCPLLAPSIVLGIQ